MIPDPEPKNLSVTRHPRHRSNVPLRQHVVRQRVEFEPLDTRGTPKHEPSAERRAAVLEHDPRPLLQHERGKLREGLLDQFVLMALHDQVEGGEL